MRVLVFGTTGMLGSMVLRRLTGESGLEAHGASRTGFGGTIAFDASRAASEQAVGLFAGGKWDYWINCIGVIKPYCKDNDPAGVRNALRVNAVFPHELAAIAKENGVRLIQIATDCVFSGARGSYLESDPHDALDVYGKTKSLGEVLDESALNIRVSIIGPELKNRVSLLEWFLGQPPGSELKGFTHHRWNGISTLRFAEICREIVARGRYDSLVRQSAVHHYVPADAVDKYELLNIFQEVFGANHRIVPVGDIGPAVDRTLASRYGALAEILPPVTIAEDLRRLRAYMERGAAP
jgi:dTDP-4-dehydrorhamnose reductase